MQTFLPYADFEQSALTLDKRRQFKQCVEASQILDVIQGKTVGWKNHPAVRMWEGFTPALQLYYNVFYYVAKKKHNINFIKLQPIHISEEIIYPDWLGWEPLHSSHRARLLHKKPEYYYQFGWTETPRTPQDGYVWPNIKGKS